MKQPLFKSIFINLLSFAVIGLMVSPAISGGPADGSIRFMSRHPHMMTDGTVGGSFHH